MKRIERYCHKCVIIVHRSDLNSDLLWHRIDSYDTVYVLMTGAAEEVNFQDVRGKTTENIYFSFEEIPKAAF